MKRFAVWTEAVAEFAPGKREEAMLVVEAADEREARRVAVVDEGHTITRVVPA